MIYKWDICEGEILATSAGSQNHHPVDPEIWARQNCFSCMFQSTWLGTAHKARKTGENEKEYLMKNHRNIEKFRLEGTSDCYLVRVFSQSRDNCTGYSGPCLGFYFYFCPLCFVLLFCTSRKSLTASSNTLAQGSWREQENHPQLLLFKAEQAQFPESLPVHSVLQMPTHPICWTPSFLRPF